MVISLRISRITNTSISTVLVTLLSIGFLGARPVRGQDKPYETDELARRLASRLSASDKKGVLVIDLANPAGQQQVFGEWLANRISLSLSKGVQTVEVIDRNDLYATLKGQLPPEERVDVKTANTLGYSTGANTIVLGSYGLIDADLGVTLVAYRVSEGGPPMPPNYMIAMINGKIPITSEVRNHLIDPPDSLRPKDGIYSPGVGGISMPTCIRCTPPSAHVPEVDVPGLVRDKRGGGDVVLHFVLTAEGRVTDATIAKPVGYGLDEQYLKAAADWEFTPAVDPNNKPVPVHMSFDVRFNFAPPK